MKLAAEAETWIELATKDDECGEWCAGIARAAMVWAYQDAWKIANHPGDWLDIADEIERRIKDHE